MIGVTNVQCWKCKNWIYGVNKGAVYVQCPHCGEIFISR